MAESWLHKAVCIQRPELWLTVGYLKLCVDRDLNFSRRLHESMCRQRPELWLRVRYMKLCVDRDLNCA